MSNLKPLVWIDNVATAAGRSYTIHETVSGDYYCRIYNMMTQSSSDSSMYSTLAEVKHFAEFEHYIPKTTSEFLIPDSTQRIENWFKAAKPEPTINDVMTQYGCHLEEVCECLESTSDIEQAAVIKELATEYKTTDFGKGEPNKGSQRDNIDLLDSLCDQIVTAIGVGYMMGFDIQGALNEVIRSNDSKMVNGKFEFDANGKISKPSSYSEPDLTPFISTMQNLHKGD